MADEKPKANIILATVEYLDKTYNFRHNEINNKIECKLLKSHQWEELNENNIFIELHKKWIRITMSSLISLLKSDYVPKYNPFLNYFENLDRWKKNEVDHIKKLSQYVILEDRERFDVQFKKMLVRVVACSLDENVFNKQAFIFTQEKQNGGKTSFSRFLVPPALKDYFAENIGTDKDSRIALCENFIINLDELARLHKNDINALKSVFSSQSEKVRRPYDRRAERLTRRASFIGSTNSLEFLTDETGSVRWLCFVIDKINWDYAKEVDINKVWAQAYSLYKSGFEYQLTLEEIEENNDINAAHNIITSEMELIQLYLEPATIDQYDEFWNSSQIMQYLMAKTEKAIPLNAVTIGKALKILGFQREQKLQGKYQIKGYYLSYLLGNTEN
jgi:predicted P-loop ATPase